MPVSKFICGNGYSSMAAQKDTTAALYVLPITCAQLPNNGYVGWNNVVRTVVERMSYGHC